MGGMLDWSALPVLVDVYGVDDVETLIKQLTTIRDDQAEQAREAAGRR